MRKRILSLLLCCVMLLGLMPVTAFADGEGSENTQNETICRYCFSCKKYRNQEIIGYTGNSVYGTSDTMHFIIVKCLTCNENSTFVDGEDKYKLHTGGTETPTCTTGKTCEKCGAEYGKPGHGWGAWQSNGDNKTHTRTCKREGCSAVDTAGCGGDDTATCVTLGTCADCGQKYYSGHTFPSGFKWTSDTDIYCLARVFSTYILLHKYFKEKRTTIFNDTLIIIKSLQNASMHPLSLPLSPLSDASSAVSILLPH